LLKTQHPKYIMACTSCSTSDGGAPKGCKNNGTCGTDSCNKLTVFDWLSNMSLSNGETPFDCAEIRFKNGRKEFYRNTEKLTLSMGDVVATEASSGHDIGIITLTGELVKIQMKKKKVKLDSPEILKIYRKASQKDIDIWSLARDKEEPMKVRARELAIEQKLEMKISDIEFQGDGSKATFYYTANDRVDFRLLIKDFAKEFSTRIEMKQVGFRQEAARLGGIGSCGRELCCSTWLTDFRSVNTSAARYQQLSLNPQKLAGQCGKLKCCLNFELDTYMDALKDFPEFETKLVTEKGDAICQKQDIFKGLMWFAYTNNFANWHVLKIEQVREIIAENKLKNKVTSLEDYALEIVAEPQKDFNNAMGQESLTRFDQPKPSKNNRNKKRKPEGANVIVANKPKGDNIIKPAIAVANKNPNLNPNTAPKTDLNLNPNAVHPINSNQKANANNPNRQKKKKPNNNNTQQNNEKANANNPNYKPKVSNSNQQKPAENRVSNKIIPNKKNETNE
jgi:cell fate regulator YaaT (PSP1 superfamily)